MRIALVSPLFEAVPPKAYGGTERVVAALANALTWKGHHVSLFATADSQVDAELIACRDRPIFRDRRNCAEVPDHLRMLQDVRKQAKRFDLIHFHTEFLHFPLFEDIAEKTLTTCHSRLDFEGLVPFFRQYDRYPLVSISDAQRRPLPQANWVGTIAHGYPQDQFRVIPNLRKSDGYLAFLGRITPDKGIEDAIEIARRTNRQLKIAARINDTDRSYWERAIAPLIDGEQIQYIGEINDHQKSEFLGAASALLFPIQWPEPFGLVMIEAMACGTPVIAFREGAVPEVLEDGVTGAIVSDVNEAVAAVQDLTRFNVERIRRQFEDRFSAEAMADRYVEVYSRVLADSERRKQTQKNYIVARALPALRPEPGEKRLPRIQPSNDDPWGKTAL